jgi:ribonuclease BN (tRNA processing enzyme)
MMTAVPGRLRLTVLGCSTAVPHPASPSAGYLVEWEETAVLLDVGQGVVRRLERVLDPRNLAAVIVGHMHADHFLDLAGLRYLYPWAEGADERLPVHLPPGGRRRLEALADAISERPGFFDPSYATDEYDPGLPLHVGPLTVRFARARHYVPAWGVSIEAPDGARLVYTGDTGPSETMTGFAHGADLLLVEAALVHVDDDDPGRGHLTVDEAIDLATGAEVRAALLVHYAPDRRDELERSCEATGPWIRPAVAGLTRTVSSRVAIAGRASWESRAVKTRTAPSRAT